MASVSSNFEDVDAAFAAIARTFDLTRKGSSASLGLDIRSLIATSIFARSIDDQMGADSPWDDNAESYRKTKEKAGKPVGVLDGKLGGHMLSQRELEGEAAVEPDSLTMSYGTNNDTRRKLNWFSNGSSGTDGEPSGARGQPARPGTYELDKYIEAEIDDYLDAAADAWLRSLE